MSDSFLFPLNLNLRRLSLSVLRSACCYKKLMNHIEKNQKSAKCGNIFPDILYVTKTWRAKVS